MTLTQHQRINVALATGITLRGKMKYEVQIRHLSARRAQKVVAYGFVVEAATPGDAAREAASRVAKKHYDNGEAGSVQEVGENTFIAIVGEQSLVSARGLVTYGFSIVVVVKPVPAPTLPKADMPPL